MQRLADALELAPDERIKFEVAGKPAPLTSFIGLEKDCDQVERLLASSRMVTLLGVGGLGKTRLALAVADRFTASSSVPVIFVVADPLACVSGSPTSRLLCRSRY